MKTITTRQYICQHCGVNFTNRPYAERIGHENATTDHNTDVTAYRFNHNKGDWFSEMKDACDIDIERGNYDCSMEIAKCLIKRFRNGVPHYDEGKFKDVKYPEIADFIQSNIHKIKEWYLEKFIEKRNEIAKEYAAKINDYNSRIEELQK